jgi:hypothetical protein
MVFGSMGDTEHNKTFVAAATAATPMSTPRFTWLGIGVLLAPVTALARRCAG